MGNQTSWAWVHGAEGGFTGTFQHDLYHHVNDVGSSSTQENLNSFVPHWMGFRMVLHCESVLILWLGELKQLTTTIAVDSDMFGMFDQTTSPCNVLGLTLDTSF